MHRNVLGLFDWRCPLSVLSRFRLLSGILVCLGRLLQLSLDIGPRFSGGCFLDYFLLLDVDIDQIFYISSAIECAFFSSEIFLQLLRIQAFTDGSL